MNPLDQLTHHPNITRIHTQPLAPIQQPDSIRALTELITRLEANHTPPGPTSNPDWYGWIPLPLEHYLNGMHTARQTLGPGQHRYLEIGSGIGTKLCLAHALGHHATGIENHPAYIQTSRQLFPHCPVIQANAATHEDYNQYDLVYSYGIATTTDQHHRINQHITSHMKPGALIFAARPPFPDWLEHIAGRVWRKP